MGLKSFMGGKDGGADMQAIHVTFNFDKKTWLDNIAICKNKRKLRNYVALAKEYGATDEEIKAALEKGGYKVV